MIGQSAIRHLVDRLKLYKKRIIGRIAHYIFMVFGKFMIWLDTIDRSPENKRHTLGWACVFKKQ